jgi:hypothetical protein
MARGVPAPQWFANSLVEFKADFWGGYLDSTQIGILYAALNTYTAAI